MKYEINRLFPTLKVPHVNSLCIFQSPYTEGVKLTCSYIHLPSESRLCGSMQPYWELLICSYVPYVVQKYYSKTIN